MAIKKSFRVKRSADFDAIFKKKNSFANRAFIVYQLENQAGHYRVGLSVSKKLGNAVRRNRVKRLMRHVLRELLPVCCEKDLVVIARPGVELMDFAAVKKNLRHVLKQSKIIES